MAYEFKMNEILLPIPPSKIQTKYKGQNKTINLINEGEVNILKLPGLTEYSFTVMIPQVLYPFAIYPNNKYVKATEYLNLFRRLHVSRKPFKFEIRRYFPNGKGLFGTNTDEESNKMVTLEDYKVTEDANNGFDLMVDITLKEYRTYETAVKKIGDDGKQEKKRETSKAPSAKAYTVVKGDTLWAIAKKYYGDGSKYTVIYNANKDKIRSPSLIYPGTVLKIP